MVECRHRIPPPCPPALPQPHLLFPSGSAACLPFSSFLGLGPLLHPGHAPPPPVPGTVLPAREVGSPLRKACCPAPSPSPSPHVPPAPTQGRRTLAGSAVQAVGSVSTKGMLISLVTQSGNRMFNIAGTRQVIFHLAEWSSQLRLGLLVAKSCRSGTRGGVDGDLELARNGDTARPESISFQLCH